MKLAAVAICLIILLPQPVTADVFKYHPASPLRIGGGFDPLRPAQTFTNCLKEAEIVRLSQGPPETTFDVSSVTSRRELYERLHLDASISGSYGLFSASGSMTLDEEYDFTENELVWILKATSDWGNYAVKSIDLTAQAMGFANDPSVFFDRCGTHVVTQHRKVVVAAALFSARDFSEKQRRIFQAMASGSFGSMFSAGLNLESEKRELEQVAQYRLSVFAIGGDGLPKLRQLVTSAKLSEVRPILKDYVETLNEEKSVPIEFLTTPWATGGGPKPKATNVEFRRLAVGEYYFVFRDLQKALQETGNFIRQLVNLPNLSTTQQMQLAQFSVRYSALADRIKTIQARGMECLNPVGDCVLRIDATPLPPAPTPVFEEVWVSVDEAGRELFFDMFYEGPNLPARNDFYLHLAWGDIEKAADQRGVRFKRVQTLKKDTLIEDKGSKLTEQNRRYEFGRHWNANQRHETIRLFYERLVRRCVQNCIGVRP